MTDELKSFKIGDQLKRGVEQPRAKNAEPEASPSVGFPRIEAFVEAAVPDLGGLIARKDQLEAIAAGGGSPKEKGFAKKAALAYQRTQELLEMLLATKAKMQSPAEPAKPEA